MVNKSLIVERGDIVWIDFSPTKGREQSGLRPSVVISPSKYNYFTGLAVVCPMTSRHKDYFFEVPVEGPSGKSFVLADQLRTFDIKERIVKKTGKITESEINDILAR